MKIGLSLIFCIAAVTTGCLLYSFSSILAADTSETVPFLGGSATAGERYGLGAFTGIAQFNCKTEIYGCFAYGAHAGYRFSNSPTSFVEAGGGLMFLVIPVYAGIGIRMKEHEVTGGQVSVATGFFPFFLITRAYNEKSDIAAEISLAFFWPLKAIPMGSR